MPTKTARPDYRAAADAVVARYGRDPDFLIPMLQDLQAEHEHVPPEAMKRLAEVLDVPLSRIYSIATFYTTFSLTPRGKHLITLCVGTVCYLKGAKAVAEAIQGRLKVEPGGTTEDRLFTFQPVNCLGACALAPVMVIDAKYYGKVTPDKIPEILAEYGAKELADS
jgi:NADH-quinone oxidoreductase subunit E